MPCSSPYPEPKSYGGVTIDTSEIEQKLSDIMNLLKKNLDDATARYCRLSFNVVDRYGLKTLNEMVSKDDLTYLQKHDEEDVERVVKFIRRFDKKELVILHSYLNNLKQQGAF